MTTPLSITADMDVAPWTDLNRAEVLHGQLDRVGLLPNGTMGGRASVALCVRLDDGRHVIAETTWALFNIAARALAATPIATAEG